MNKKTITTEAGNEINLKDYQHSLHTAFPSYARKAISDEGEPFLMNVVEKPASCGCKISGNGTLQFPLKIIFCEKHNF